MIHIGRYRISFRRAFWTQTRVPTTARRFWPLWVLREARPTDVDKDKRFEIGTGWSGRVGGISTGELRGRSQRAA